MTNLHGLKKQLKKASQRLRYLEVKNKGTRKERGGLKRKISELKGGIKTKRKENVKRKQNQP